MDEAMGHSGIGTSLYLGQLFVPLPSACLKYEKFITTDTECFHACKFVDHCVPRSIVKQSGSGGTNKIMLQ